MKLLEGKVAVITGAARGIGKAVALCFAENGADIAFTDLSIDENGRKTEEEILAFGVRCKAYASNAADFQQTHEVVEKIMGDFGRIDILVNNAGITWDGLMLKMEEKQWDMVININLKSAFNFIHAVTPVMMRQRSGSIINMSSVVGVHGNAGQANYSASKAGMIGLAMLPVDVKEVWNKKIPLRRGGTPEEIAKVALFLGSDLSSYVSGQVIEVNGAMNS